MAFNTLEYLEQGNIDFIFNLTTYDYKSLIINVRNSNRRNEIVKGFINKLIDEKPKFCLLIIYDMPEYYNETLYLLNKYFRIESFSKEEIENFLNNSKAASKYLIDNIDILLTIYKDNLDFIFKFLIAHREEYPTLVDSFAFSKDMKIRYLFMKYLILNNKELIPYFYDDISKYLTADTSRNYEQLTLLPIFLNSENISELAFLIFDSQKDYETYTKIKEFILKNYEFNSLADHLLEFKQEPVGEHCFKIVDNRKGIIEFAKDADTYFKSASRGKLRIYRNHQKLVSNELIEQYRKYLSYFRDGEDTRLSDIDYYGLSHKLEEYIEKYLDLSTDKTHKFIESGSTANCYRIGDYVFKLSSTKWSYEDIICPDLYLILRNLEEDFIRNDKGIVVAAIEIQKYLKRTARNIPIITLKLFRNELDRLGYYTTDSLMNGPCGDNCRLLDDYKESGELNPPDWFKETPLVLVDRDRVYRKDNIYPKQLRSYD